jgi:TetR/AcrR family transcriptional regulator, cholesterol catabolism regulator
LNGRPSYDSKLLKILRESACVFAEKGYHRASIRDISGATGVSLSGLYYYFSSKEELLFLIQDHCFGTLLHTLEEDLEGVQDPETRLRILVRNHLHFFVDNVKEMKVLSHEADVLSGDFKRKIHERKRSYARTLSMILSALQRAASSPGSESMDSPELESKNPGDHTDPRLRAATFALFGMMNWIYTWYNLERDLPVDELEEEFLHLFLHGYLTPRFPSGAPALPEGPSMGSSSIWRRE